MLKVSIPIVAGVWAAAPSSSSSEELPTLIIAGAFLEAKYEEVCLLIFVIDIPIHEFEFIRVKSKGSRLLAGGLLVLEKPDLTSSRCQTGEENK